MDGLSILLAGLGGVGIVASAWGNIRNGRSDADDRVIALQKEQIALQDKKLDEMTHELRDLHREVAAYRAENNVLKEIVKNRGEDMRPLFEATATTAEYMKASMDVLNKIANKLQV